MNYLEQLEQTIQKYGWCVQSVFPTEYDDSAPFAYSIGLHDKGIPELIVIGLPPQIGHQLINETTHHLLRLHQENSLLTGIHTLSNWPMPFAILEAHPDLAKEYAVGADNRSAGLASYLQIVWPSESGLYPWDEQAPDEAYKKHQPLLTPRAS